jgi:hypothetical protein
MSPDRGQVTIIKHIQYTEMIIRLIKDTNVNASPSPVGEVALSTDSKIKYSWSSYQKVRQIKTEINQLRGLNTSLSQG